MNEPTRMQVFAGELVRLLVREGYDVDTSTRRHGVQITAHVRREDGKRAGMSYLFDTIRIEQGNLAPMSIAIDAAEMFRQRMPVPS